MIRSKLIADYFQINLTDIKPGEPLEFDVHLYFTSNQHVMVWRQAGITISKEDIEKYQARGLNQLWIHRDEQAAFEKYRDKGGAEKPVAVSESVRASDSVSDLGVAPAAAASAEPEAPEAPRTAEGAFIAAALSSPSISDEQKKAVVSKAAQEVLRTVAEAKTPAEQRERTQHAQKVVQDVLDAAQSEVKTLIADIRKVVNFDSDLEHGLNVSTYAVLFAMSFGTIEQELMADLATAGLIHDLGMTQVPPSNVRKSQTERDADDFLAYVDHVERGLELMELTAPEMPKRVRTLIQQHHEKFDGTGYPQRLAGFRFDDVAQLLAMAEVLESVVSGEWDGTKRTVSEGFKFLESLEKARTFPSYFNPEVFGVVIRWTQSVTDNKVLSSASALVGQRVREVVGSKN